MDESPAITIANSTIFTSGASGKFTIKTTGFPVAAISESGTLPHGVTLVDKGNGKTVLSGMPASGVNQTITLKLKAKNAISKVTQTFALVMQKPAMTPSFEYAKATIAALHNDDTITGVSESEILTGTFVSDSLLREG